MKKSFSRLLAFAAACSMTVSALFVSGISVSALPETKTQLNYYICPNSQLLMENASDYSGLEHGGVLNFNMAANERESAQIVLAPLNKYTSFHYTCFEMKLSDDFKSSDGKSSISKSNFEMYFEHYVEVDKSRWNLAGLGSYPDALIPYKLATDTRISASKRANEFVLDGNQSHDGKRNQGLWFTMKVPEGTKPGTYRTKLVCSYGIASNSPCYQTTIPVVVQVYDFELDNVTNSKTRFAASTGHFGIDGSNVSALKDVIGIESSWKDEAENKYQTEVSEFLNERKLSSGYNFGTYYFADELAAEISKLAETIENPATKAPYYNIYSGYYEAESLVKLDSNLSKNNVVNNFISKTGISLGEDAKDVLQTAASKITSSVTQEKLCSELEALYKNYKSANNRTKQQLSSFFLFLLKPDLSVKRYPMEQNRTGLQMVMEKLVDKSIDDNFDLLQYGFVRVPQIDEPDADSFKHNMANLLSSYIVEDTKKSIKTYIENNSKLNQNPALKDSLLKSLNKVVFVSTSTPTENSGSLSDMLYGGLNAIKNTEIWKYYEQFRKNKYSSYSSGFVREYTVYGTKTKYTVNLPMNYRMNSFCPQFNDFNEDRYSSTAPVSQLKSKLSVYQQNNTDFWWYSTLVSGYNPSVAGYMINENQSKKSGESLNALAVSRVNKWNQYLHGISGELYWGVDVYYTKDAAGNKIFKNDIGITATGQDDDTAADGMLIYPTKQLLKNVYGVTNESVINDIIKENNYFCSSIRLENIAEANDDYDYLCLAQKLIKQKEKEGKNVSTIQSDFNHLFSYVLNEGSYSYTKSVTNSSNLSYARAALARLIVSLNTEEVAPANSRFYTKRIDKVLNWKNSTSSICFDFKATNSINKGSNNNVTLYIQSINAQTNAWESVAKTYTIDVVNGTSKIGTVTSLGNGWYRAKIPFKAFEANSSADGLKSVDVVGFDWVNRSFEMKNFKITR